MDRRVLVSLACATLFACMPYDPQGSHQSPESADETISTAAPTSETGSSSDTTPTSEPASTSEDPAVCGDGHVDAGEECDDANHIDGDACTNACALSICGDGVVGPGEGCDDGNQVDTDSCRNTCTPTTCGDGELQVSEACDDGGESAECNADCSKSKCGDNVVNSSAGETCDDGNNEDDDGCSGLCTLEVCGDGIVQGEETCDDGDVVDADACSAVCKEQKVLQVSTGHRHTCALLSGGVIKCWGLNDHGQLGLGDTLQRGDEPGEMGDSLPAVDLGAAAEVVAAGSFFTCALLIDGRIKCWGDSAYGQLGLGGVESAGDQPDEMGIKLPAVDLGAGQTATGISLGSYHSCALIAGGDTKCWGLNEYGQLGLGDVQDRGDDLEEMGEALLRVDIEGQLAAQQMAPASSHTCAILDGGIVRCWGDGSFGEVGLGSLQVWGDQPGEMGANLPSVSLGAGTAALLLGPGREHTCVLLVGGAVKCWGRGIYGGLGSGNEANIGDQAGEMGDDLPEVDLGDAQTSIDISAGHYTTCALLQDGAIKCWGLNQFGQLGQGDVLNRGDGPGEMGEALAPIELGVAAIRLRRGPDAHSVCAILIDHSLKCWGWNGNGQLGLGDNQNRGDGPGEMGVDLPRVRLFSDQW
jgi:cysteine-rich repeat protein